MIWLFGELAVSKIDDVEFLGTAESDCGSLVGVPANIEHLEPLGTAWW